MKSKGFHGFVCVMALSLLTAPAAAEPVQCHSSQKPYFDALGIQTDFKIASQLAAKENKPIVIIFSAKNARLPGFQ
jgi:hypothetical protein